MDRPSTYGEAAQWLLGLELFGMDFGTGRMTRLLDELGNPQSRFRAVHVVGSNGKSSTTRLTDAVLRAHGESCGAYLSPHLRSWTERVLIGGDPVTEDAFAASAAEAAAAVAAVDGEGSFGPVTQFEALTATAFLLLAGAGVKVAVIEAGLGGRLDATNVVGAPVSICTSVGLEHTQWLGETIREIASEKLDVVKGGSVLVVPADLPTEAMDVAVRVSRERRARVIVAPVTSTLAPAGTAPYLSHNLALAVAAAHEMLGRIDEAAVRSAIAAGALHIPGRFEITGQAPMTIFDGAHNADGVVALARALRQAEAKKPLVACVAVLDDKDDRAMLEALAGVVDRVVATSCAHPRSLEPGRVAESARAAGIEADEVAEPHSALARARELAGDRGTVIVAGSLYLIADLGRPPGSGGGSTL